MSDKYDKLLMGVMAFLTVLSILVSIGAIVGLLWYAIAGDPAADIGHFIKEVRSAAK